jgi:D-3-phosphoglycerate dehydrogenase
VDESPRPRLEELYERIGEYDGLITRSLTSVTPELLRHATRLRIVGRAGVGVDNIDVDACSRRGIVVVNAPHGNVVSAAEHTVGMLLALVRHIPQAHRLLTSLQWNRGFYGVELFRKTIGVVGLGKVGSRVAARLRAFETRILVYDPYVGEARARELGAVLTDFATVLRESDVVTFHTPLTAETDNMLTARELGTMKRGVRIVNCARGGLVDEAALYDAVVEGRVAGAALDVFETEPITEHPLFGYPNVVVTPHLGASTAEATDRAGVQTAEQVIAALTGGAVTTAVNVPAIAAEDLEVLGPFLPLCQSLGRLATALAEPAPLDRVEVECLGRIAERDTRPLGVAVLVGALAGRTEEDVNAVNAPQMAEERGIEYVEAKRSVARDFTDLVRVTVAGRRVVGTVLGQRHRPHLLEAWGQRFNLQLEDHLALFRYRDVPGMIGRVGTTLGEHGINIGSAAVGHVPEDLEDDGCAVMVVTTDQPVPAAVLDELLADEEFVEARAVSL